MVNAFNEPDRQLFHCTYTDVIKIPIAIYLILVYCIDLQEKKNVMGVYIKQVG